MRERSDIDKGKKGKREKREGTGRVKIAGEDREVRQGEEK